MRHGRPSIRIATRLACLVVFLLLSADVASARTVFGWFSGKPDTPARERMRRVAPAYETAVLTPGVPKDFRLYAWDPSDTLRISAWKVFTGGWAAEDPACSLLTRVVFPRDIAENVAAYPHFDVRLDSCVQAPAGVPLLLAWVTIQISPEFDAGALYALGWDQREPASFPCEGDREPGILTVPCCLVNGERHPDGAYPVAMDPRPWPHPYLPTGGYDTIAGIARVESVLTPVEQLHGGGDQSHLQLTVLEPLIGEMSDSIMVSSVAVAHVSRSGDGRTTLNSMDGVPHAQPGDVVAFVATRPTEPLRRMGSYGIEQDYQLAQLLFLEQSPGLLDQLLMEQTECSYGDPAGDPYLPGTAYVDMSRLVQTRVPYHVTLEQWKHDVQEHYRGEQ